MTASHKIGFLGDGAIAQKHKDAIAAVPGLEVGIVCDITKGNDGWKALAAESDAVLICTPSAGHASQIMALADMGADTIICEKPIGLFDRELDDLEVWQEKNPDVRVVPVFQNRFLATAQGVKAISDCRSRPFHVDVRVWWNRNADYYNKRDWYNYPSQTGVAVIHQALHFVDLPLWWNAKSYSFDYNLRTHGGNYGVEIAIFGEDYFVCLCGDTANMVRDCRGTVFPFPWQGRASPRVDYWSSVFRYLDEERYDPTLGTLGEAIAACREAMHWEMTLNPAYRVMDHG